MDQVSERRLAQVHPALAVRVRRVERAPEAPQLAAPPEPLPMPEQSFEEWWKPWFAETYAKYPEMRQCEFAARCAWHAAKGSK